MSTAKKQKTISMRLTEQQFNEIDKIIDIIEKETGTRVTKSSIILKMMEFGYPTLKEKYPQAFGIELAGIEKEEKKEKVRKLLAFFSQKNI